MDARETYMNVIFANPYPRSPSRDGLTCTYSELMIGKGEPPSDHDVESPVASGPGEWPITVQTDGLNSSYSVLNLPKDEYLVEEYEDPPISSGHAAMSVTAQADCLKSIYSKLNFWRKDPLIGEDEGPPIATGPGGMPTTSQTAAHEQESKVKIENRPYRQICLLRLVTSALIVIVFGLSIHVSQIRQQFTEMETKYRSVNETKAQICELLTSRREQACAQEWIRNEDRCYFISTFTMPYGEAKELCSHLDSKLFEINLIEEEKFITKTVGDQDRAFWIGKCKTGEVASNVVYKVNAGKIECGECKSPRISSCKDDLHRFICEKPAPLCPDIPEKIRDLCQKPVGPTEI
ncbi:uncharacterized protein [Hemitrygon akajei]|uniref:uncharacterized protein n=1 Tax=Hemitrygon akajei TaxID=2704970 RepID=UPI003BF94FA2